jgi:hypothetical protein
MGALHLFAWCGVVYKRWQVNGREHTLVVAGKMDDPVSDKAFGLCVTVGLIPGLFTNSVERTRTSRVSEWIQGIEAYGHQDLGFHSNVHENEAKYWCRFSW